MISGRCSVVVFSCLVYLVRGGKGRFIGTSYMIAVSIETDEINM